MNGFNGGLKMLVKNLENVCHNETPSVMSLMREKGFEENGS